MKKPLAGLLVITIALAILLHQSFWAIAQPKKIIKGVWLTNVDSEVLYNDKELAKAIEQLSQMNFNTLYPTIWNDGYTLYPSKIAQKYTGYNLDPHQELQERKIVKEIIDLARPKNIRVIPWFEFGLMAPENSQLASLHDHWLTQRSDGSKIWLEGGSIPRVWLNPLHPEVQEFIKGLVLEIASNYDVDGIQFDDHFGYPAELGYDPYTISLYKQEHQGKTPPADYHDVQWVQWRADKITEFLANIVKDVKTIKPEAIISISPNPQKFSLNSFLSDWACWEEQGLIDELVLQVYRKNIARFIKEISQPEVVKAKKNIPFAIGIMTGVKGDPTPLNLMTQQIEEVSKRSFDGVSFFFYESLWNLGPESAPERQKILSSAFAKS
jgi:uncharacterized lipoprotein YddW (UPF0748 family)